jgi:hypothetical protein
VRSDVPRANASRRRIGPDQIRLERRSVYRAQQSYDLSRHRMSSELRLLKDRRAVPRYLEASTGARAKLHVRLGKLLLELGRQPDGPGLVVSNRAVLDRDLHDWRILVWCSRGNIAPSGARCATAAVTRLEAWVANSGLHRRRWLRRHRRPAGGSAGASARRLPPGALSGVPASRWRSFGEHAELRPPHPSFRRTD